MRCSDGRQVALTTIAGGNKHAFLRSAYDFCDNLGQEWSSSDQTCCLAAGFDWRAVHLSNKRGTMAYSCIHIVFAGKPSGETVLQLASMEAVLQGNAVHSDAVTQTITWTDVTC